MANHKRTLITSLQSIFLGLITLIFLAPACAPEVIGNPEKLPPFSELVFRCAKWMEGSFSNKKQSEEDSTFPPGWLHQVRIWPDRSDGIWLYSEETQNGNTQRPLRQNVYRLTDDIGGGLLIEVYTLPGDPLRFASSWHTPRDFNRVDPFNLNLCGGCNLHLSRQPDGKLDGSTKGTSCASSRNGAAYLTQSVEIGSLEIKQWIRGYDAYGKQVFGSTKGPTLFEKVNPAAVPESIKPGSDHVPDIGPHTPR